MLPALLAVVASTLPVIGPHPVELDMSGTDGFRRCTRVALMPYSNYEWREAHSTRLAEAVATGLGLTEGWTVSLGVVDWEDGRYSPGGEKTWEEAEMMCERLGGWVAKSCENCWSVKRNGRCYVGSGVEKPCGDERRYYCERPFEGDGKLTLQVHLRGDPVAATSAPVFTTAEETDFAEMLIHIIIAEIGEMGKPLVPYAKPELTCYHNPESGAYVKRVRFVVKGAGWGPEVEDNVRKHLEEEWGWGVSLQAFDRTSDVVVVVCFIAPESAAEEDVEEAIKQIDTFTPSHLTDIIHLSNEQQSVALHVSAVFFGEVVRPSVQAAAASDPTKTLFPIILLVSLIVLTVGMGVRIASEKKPEDDEEDVVSSPLCSPKSSKGQLSPKSPCNGQQGEDPYAHPNRALSEDSIDTISEDVRSPCVNDPSPGLPNLDTSVPSKPSHSQQQQAAVLDMMVQMGINPLSSVSGRRVFDVPDDVSEIE